MPCAITVVGIDVGGARKGYHAVALENGRYRGRKETDAVGELVEWCARAMEARVVAIDAPCRWSADGRARPAERELRRERISCFSSPTREKALAHPSNYFGWMLRGEELFRALEATHRLWDGVPGASERFCFETFPHAITWQLRGGQASARRKRRERAALLLAAGIQLPVPAGIDTIDAALCALMAQLVATGAPCLGLGEAETGFIIVPATRALLV